MKKSSWQRRVKAAGLKQADLGRLLGHAKSTVSCQLRGVWKSGVPKHVIAAIIAWELMSEDQRQLWLDWASSEQAASADNFLPRLRKTTRKLVKRRRRQEFPV